MIFKNNIQLVMWLLFAAHIAIALIPKAGAAENQPYAIDGTTNISKRIEVYALNQNYWDTQYGDTLSEIVAQLLPHNPSKQSALMLDIVSINPHAFVGANPTRLLANKRLRLPGYMKQFDSIKNPTRANPTNITVESYSWGNIKRPIK